MNYLISRLRRVPIMSESKKYLGWILLLGVYLFFLGNWGIAITDPVESNYALTAKVSTEYNMRLAITVYFTSFK